MTAAKGWPRPMPKAADAGAYGVEIHRHAAPRDWPAALAHVPDALREGAESYLRGIAERIRCRRGMPPRREARA